MAYFGTSDGARIFYTDTGQGKPVLLLHGWRVMATTGPGRRLNWKTGIA
jgi:pimeloyl-ACP methyl ester carboxylesterase